MFRLILLFVSLSIFWGGGQSLYTTLSNSEPTKLSCATFLAEENEQDWFELFDCYGENSAIIMVYEEGDAGTQSDFFLPLYGAEGDIGSKPIKAYMKLTSRVDKLAFVQTMNAQDANKDMTEFYAENPKAYEFVSFSGKMAISGLREFGIETDDSTRETLYKNANNEDFVIIEQNSQPDPLGMSLSLLGFGFLIFFGVMWSFSRDEDDEEDGAAEA